MIKLFAVDMRLKFRDKKGQQLMPVLHRGKPYYVNCYLVNKMNLLLLLFLLNPIAGSFHGNYLAMDQRLRETLVNRQKGLKPILDPQLLNLGHVNHHVYTKNLDFDLAQELEWALISLPNITNIIKIIKDLLPGDCLPDLQFLLNDLNVWRKAVGKQCGNANASVECDCEREKQHNISLSSWTLKVFDSYGKLPQGFLEGNTFWLGEFEECRSIHASRIINKQMNKFNGKYCMMEVPINLDITGGISLSSHCSAKNSSQNEKNPATEGRRLQQTTSLKYGICIPDSCQGLAFSMITTIMYNLYVNSTGANSYVTGAIPVTCHDIVHIKDDLPAMIMIVVGAIFLFLMITGTLYDVFVYLPVSDTLPSKAADFNMEKRHMHAGDCKTKQEYYDLQNPFSKFLIAFSAYSNGKKLLSVEKRDGQLECIHGIRFVSMTWVILGHTYYFAANYMDNLGEFAEILKEFPSQAVLNATVSVDTFFVLSGLLLTYLWLSTSRKAKGKNIRQWYHWLLYYVHRYIRLTPAYMLIMGLDIALFQYLTDGPLWNQKGVEPNHCRTSWWTNLLYVNNYVKLDEICMGWTWYLAIDMQCHWVAPLFLIPLFFAYVEYVVIGLMVVLVLATCASSGWFQWHYNFPPNAIWTLNPAQFNPDPLVGWEYFKLYYIRFYTRAGPYLIGMITGYALYKLNGKKLKIPWGLNLFIWLLMGTIAMLALFGLFPISRGDTSSEAFNVFYSAVNRQAWGLVVAWVVFACVTGNGGFINTMLSWNMIFPLSRLTYCAYLIHPLIMYLKYQGGANAIHFDSHYTMVYFFLGHIALAYGAAFVLSLAFESPILTIERLILPREHGKREQTNKEPSEVPRLMSYRNHSNDISAPVNGAVRVPNGEPNELIQIPNGNIGGPNQSFYNQGFQEKL